MIKFANLTILGVACALLSSSLYAADLPKLGIVNMPQIFNNSQFIKDETQKLQNNIKEMEEKLQDEQKKMQDLVKEYEKKKEASTQIKIAEAQTKLSQMTQDYQKKLQDEQNIGMQRFNNLVRIVVEKVAKKNHLNAVFSSTGVIYSDSTWVDITAEVKKEMSPK